MANDGRKLNRLLFCLDNKYDCVVYDTTLNIIALKVDKNATSKNLKEIMNDLSREMKYPLLKFHSDNESYTFTYSIKDEKEET